MLQKIGIASLIVTLVTLSLHSGAAAQGGNLSNAQLTSIQQRCQQVQPKLSTLQQRDAILRINRGRLYDLTLRQTGAFVDRLQLHAVNAPQVVTADNAMQREFNKFKSDFDAYAESLDHAITADCVVNPRDFYGWLLKAAADRKAVDADIKNIEKYLQEYIVGLKNLQQVPEISNE